MDLSGAASLLDPPVVVAWLGLSVDPAAWTDLSEEFAAGFGLPADVVAQLGLSVDAGWLGLSAVVGDTPDDADAGRSAGTAGEDASSPASPEPTAASTGAAPGKCNKGGSQRGARRT